MVVSRVLLCLAVRLTTVSLDTSSKVMKPFSSRYATDFAKMCILYTKIKNTFLLSM